MNQLSRLMCGLLLSAVFLTSLALGQATPGGTQIKNTASATYGDGSGTSYSTLSNEVVIAVANVAGLVITPDNSVLPNLVPGQVTVQAFAVTNTGNFTQPVTFGASGSSASVVGPATITKLVIDANGNGIIDPTDTDILTNAAAVNCAPLVQNGSLKVLAEITVNPTAADNSAITVKLGDSATDSVATNNSANEVKTTDASAVNGILEATGSYTTTVDKDAEIAITLTAPAGPVTPGSDISYNLQACNSGERTANAITLPGAPGGSNSAVFLIAPIPTNTSLKAGQSFPSNTLYSTSPLATAPMAATWTTTVPSPISSVTRMAFPAGSSLAAGACTASFPLVVTINPGLNPATVPNISEIVDVFATNTLNNPITDQSGDTVPNKGDGNANFDEGPAIGSSDGNGVQQQTAVAGSPNMYMGPASNAASTQAESYTSNCEHYDGTLWPTPAFNTITGNYVFVSPKRITNYGSLPLSFGLIQGHKELDTGYSTYTPYTGATAGVLFDNAPDITAEVSFDGGATWKLLKSFAGLNSATSILTSQIHSVDPLNVPMNGITLNPGQAVDFLLRYTVPAARFGTGHNTLSLNIYAGWYFAGTNTPIFPSYTRTTTARVFNGIGVSGTCPKNETFESTGDTLVGDSLKVVKAATVTNTTGVGAATDAVPGAEIEYVLTITGQGSNGTSGTFPWDAKRYSLTSTGIAITEDGTAAPNNWGNLTNQVVGSATCSVPFTVTGDSAGSTNLTFNLTSGLPSGGQATCRFRRTVK
ncbi:MAG: hypothetical protein JNM09_00170 [Blastocatellia bacterium]|nr:hypothetical protein [Blastocatellia bacterium]